MIETRTRTAFWAPTRRRSYFSRAAAVRAEAVAIIKRKHPDINDHETGESFCWCIDLKRHDVLFRRMMKLVDRASRGRA